MVRKSMNGVLKEQLTLIKPDKQVSKYLKNLTGKFKTTLEKEIRKQKVDASVFIGGSFAKGTLVKKYDYDVDVYVRFDWRHDEISDMLEKVLKKTCKDLGLLLERLHGSRDYFKAKVKNEGHYFEVIPVSRIRKPQEAKNITDLSYFHVPYVKKKMKGIEDQLLLAKTFCHAQKVYGAETYVRGFSGYALECLIIHYKSFRKMLRELSKIKIGDRLVIDIEKKYKKKSDVFFELNESKLHSPVIIVDPTYRERNALASLSHETFEKFQKAAKIFLKKPDLKFFVQKKTNVTKLKGDAKKKKAEFFSLVISTDRQPGDIAGTKLKKFSDFISNEINKYFVVSGKEFEYDQGQKANLYLAARSRKEVIRIGPPLRFKKHVRAFKKEHRNTYEKNKFIHAKMKITFSAKAFLNTWKKQRSNRETIKEMGITGLEIKD